MGRPASYDASEFSMVYGNGYGLRAGQPVASYMCLREILTTDLQMASVVMTCRCMHRRVYRLLH
jgi:hypothetical protein